MERIGEAAEAIARPYRERAPEAGIALSVENDYPGPDTDAQSGAVAFVQGLTGETGTIKVAFGTEGGLFRERAKVPTVICGPGSMDQGHKPDEFVAREQVARCDAMTEALIERLADDRR
jgi:acetylornithine deacetylase